MKLFEGIDHASPYFAMLVGLPATGKSTFRSAITDQAVIISTDDWIEEKAAWEGTTYDAVWSRDIKQAETAMRERFQQAIKDGSNIIVDRTNLTVRARRGWLAPLPKKYFKLAIVFEAPDEVVYHTRLQRAGKTIPTSVLNKMREIYVPPTHEEGFDLISYGAAQ